MNHESTHGMRKRLLSDEKVREMIALRAYLIFETRGHVHGHNEEDWRQAEREVLAELIAKYEAPAGTPSGAAPRITKKAAPARKKLEKVTSRASSSKAKPKTKRSSAPKAQGVSASAESQPSLEPPTLSKTSRSRAKKTIPDE
jgi:hypothetical protein